MWTVAEGLAAFMTKSLAKKILEKLSSAVRTYGMSSGLRMLEKSVSVSHLVSNSAFSATS